MIYKGLTFLKIYLPVSLDDSHGVRRIIPFKNKRDDCPFPFKNNCTIIHVTDVSWLSTKRW